MGPDQATLKSKIMQELETRLDRRLQTMQDKGELDLGEIEALALGLEREMGQVLTQLLVDSQSATAPSAVTCPTCQQPMVDKGRKRRYLRTRSGEVQLERAYYYCRHCRRGHFPPG